MGGNRGGQLDFAKIAARADTDDADIKRWSILLGNAVGAHVRPLVVAAYGLGCIIDAGRLQAMGGKAKEGQAAANIGIASLQQALMMVGLDASGPKEGDADGSASRPDGAPASSAVPEGDGDGGQGDIPAPAAGTGDGAVDDAPRQEGVEPGHGEAG